MGQTSPLCHEFVDSSVDLQKQPRNHRSHRNHRRHCDEDAANIASILVCHHHHYYSMSHHHHHQFHHLGHLVDLVDLRSDLHLDHLLSHLVQFFLVQTFLLVRCRHPSQIALTWLLVSVPRCLLNGSLEFMLANRYHAPGHSLKSTKRIGTAVRSLACVAYGVARSKYKCSRSRIE